MTARTAVAAALALLALSACGDGSVPVARTVDATPVVLTTDGPPSETPTPSAAAPTATAAATATPAAADAVPAKGSKDFGYFTSVVSDGAQAQLAFDRATFLTGDEANKAAAAHGDETPVPNDYYVVNDNPKTRTLTLAAAVEVIGSIGLNGYAGETDDVVAPHARTVEELLAFVETDGGNTTGFHLVYGDRGLVVRVEEQYVP